MFCGAEFVRGCLGSQKAGWWRLLRGSLRRFGWVGGGWVVVGGEWNWGSDRFQECYVFERGSGLC